jgi:hypothetical protein
MKKNINEAFSTEESKEIYDKFLSIVGTRRDNLVKRYGTGAEQVAYATAVNQVKKKAANKPKEPMENTKLREMIKSALLNPKAADLNKDGKLSDYEEKRGAAIEKNLNEENIGLADIGEMGYAMLVKLHLKKLKVDSETNQTTKHIEKDSFKDLPTMLVLMV